MRCRVPGFAKGVSRRYRDDARHDPAGVLWILSARDQPHQRTGDRQDLRGDVAREHRRRRTGPGGVSGRCRARLSHARRGSRRTPDDAAVLRARARRGPSRTPPATRASTITSSTWRPGGASGTASCRRSTRRSCLAGMLDRRRLLRPRQRRTSTRSARLADALYAPRRLALGAERRRHGHARLEAGERLPAVSLGGLRRGAAALRARPRLADVPAARGELRRLDLHLRVEERLRPRVCSTPGRSSRTSSRTSGSISAASRTPSCATAGIDYFENSRRATYVQQQYAIRNPLRVRGLRRALLGDHGQRRPGLDATHGQGRRAAASSTTWRAACPTAPTTARIAPWAVVASLPFAPEIVLPTIRHFARVRPRRCSILTASRRPSTDLPGRGERPRLGVALPLRHRPGADRPDDRELPVGSALAADAQLPLRRHGAAPGRIQGRLAVRQFWLSLTQCTTDPSSYWFRRRAASVHRSRKPG